MVAVIVFMLGAMAAHWDTLASIERLVFSALSVLGGVMWWRSRQAAHLALDAGGEWSRYVDHVGFVVISLFNAFVIVSALDLGVPPAAVTAAAVAASLAGHFALKRLKRRDAPNASSHGVSRVRHVVDTHGST